MSPAQAYILDQKEPFRSILMHLQMQIEKNIQDVTLKFKYKIPFYYIQNRPFCYLIVPIKKDYVDLGFWNAAHLELHKDQMVTEHRKIMKSLRYRSLDEIDDKILKEVLMEAYMLKDKKFYK